MRALLIAIVLVLTVLAFYSALWFKSETIQADITERVTDELTAVGAQDVDIDVDGRHVTLSGLLYSEDNEKQYLQTADDTWGALGPIDGLTLGADTGYISAIKSESGITLTGTVPDETTREALRAQAAAATSGEVVDNLIVAGPIGLGQLAALSAGTLSLSAGAYALSGTTGDDPKAIESSLMSREGWNATIGADLDPGAVQADLSRLQADIAMRDDTIAGLNGDLSIAKDQLASLEATRGSLESERDGLLGERDGLRGELNDLRAGLSAEQSESSAAASQLASVSALLATSEGLVGDKDTEIAGLRGDISARDARIGELELEGEALTSRVGTLEAEIADRDASLGDIDARIAVLQGEVAERDTSLGEANANMKCRRAYRKERLRLLILTVRSRPLRALLPSAM